MTGVAVARAPATVANLSAGFDTFGLALGGPWDEVAAARTEEPGVLMEAIHGDAGRLPLDSATDTAAVSAAAVLDRCRKAGGLRLRLRKGLPLESGLGSSAASAVAGALAADAALDAGLNRDALLACALAGEQVAAGAAHADNVGPALYGGIVLVQGTRVTPLPVPAGLHCAVVRPHVSVSTREARRVLPASVPLGVAVRQCGRAAGFTAALFTGDWELLATCLEDELAEPARMAAVPGFQAVRDAARAAGALGAGLAGSGPSMFALAPSLARAEAAAAAMLAGFKAAGVKADSHVSPAGGSGAVVEPGEPSS